VGLVRNTCILFVDETLREAGYEKWNGGEPNGGTDENCGMIYRSSKIASHWCHDRLPYFCEFNY
jgi:hypothetical protein